MLKFINSGAIQKIKDFKETIEKYATVIMGCLWIISTLWDVVSFQCYWSDYMLEIYSCFFIIFMVLYSIIPQRVPKLITDYFGLITTVFGKGIIMVIFSLIFIGDKHLFHKLSSIFLLLCGICFICLDFIAPSESDNKFNVSVNVNNTSVGNEGEKRDTGSGSSDGQETKIDDSTPRSDTLDSNN